MDNRQGLLDADPASWGAGLRVLDADPASRGAGLRVLDTDPATVDNRQGLLDADPATVENRQGLLDADPVSRGAGLRVLVTEPGPEGAGRKVLGLTLGAAGSSREGTRLITLFTRMGPLGHVEMRARPVPDALNTLPAASSSCANHDHVLLGAHRSLLGLRLCPSGSESLCPVPCQLWPLSVPRQALEL